MSSQSETLPDDGYLNILEAIDELQSIAAGVKAQEEMEAARLHRHMAHILSQLVHLTEIASKSSVFMVYVSNTSVSAGPNNPIPIASIVGKHMGTRMSPENLVACAEEIATVAYAKMRGTINAQSLPSTNNAAIPNPLPPMVEDPASWANENDLTIILDLCNLCDEYMELAPPLGNDGYWGRLATDPELESRLLPLDRKDATNIQHISHPFNSAFWKIMHRKHDQYSISRFVSLLNSNPVLDADTQLLYGGRHGVRLLVLVCLRIFYAIYQLESEEPPSPKNAHVVSASHLLDYLVAGATILLEQLQTSYEHLKDIRAQGPMVRVLVRNLLAEPGARRYELPKDDVRMKSPSPPGNKPQAESQAPPPAFVALAASAERIVGPVCQAASGQGILAARS